MTTTYSYAPEVERIAETLIRDHRRDLIENGAIRIEYLFRSEAALSKGREVWGTARKVTGLNAFLAVDKGDAPVGRPGDDDEVEPFFVIEIAHDIWQTLSRRQRIALVDHELTHLRVVTNEKGETVLKLAGHDVEEFTAILRRHGTYKPDLAFFAKAAVDVAQMTFDDVTEPTPIRSVS